MTPAVTHAVRQILAHETGGGSSSELVAAGAAQACVKISRHLSKVIGDAGIRMLLDRSVTLTRAEFPWLASAEPKLTDFAQLRASLAQQDAATAITAAEFLLTTLTGLLGQFIGDRLATHLLSEIWPDVLLPNAPVLPNAPTEPL